MKKLCSPKLSWRQTLSIVLATANSVTGLTPFVAPPIAAVLAEPPAAKRETVDEAWLSHLNQGGQFLDSLFFTTAYAYTDPVISGQIVSGETVSGIQTIEDGGRTTSTTIIYGGQQDVSGIATDTTIIHGGYQNVLPGGSAASTIIVGGQQNVFGIATDTTIIHGGGQNVLPGGIATDTTIIYGGYQNVWPGGSATSTIIYGGQQDVSGIATDTTINRGNQIVQSGGSAARTAIASGGVQYVGGSATDTTIIAGGEQYVYIGGAAVGTIVNGGGTQTVYGGAVNTTIFAGGVQTIYDGGAASGTTITSGGLQYVYSGGIATDTTVSGGTLDIEAGALINGVTTLDSGVIALTGSGGYTIDSLSARGGTVRLAYGSAVGRSLIIYSLAGSTNFIINTDLAHGQADAITVTSAASSANIVQVAYDPAYLTARSVTGSAAFATVVGGSASFRAAACEYGAYSYRPIITSVTAGSVTTWAVTALTADGESETVRTAGDAAGAGILQWRAENSNLSKRLGELRNAGDTAGLWLRTYRGAQTPATVAGRATALQYTALQGGWDRKLDRKDGTIYAGYAVSCLEGSNTYSRGNGDAGSLSAGGYATWLGRKGHFLDVIAKVGRLRNSHTSYLNDTTNTRVDGNYQSWGTSLSAEYGYRRQLKNHWYLEPKAELTCSRINGAHYTASDGTSLHNGGVNSVVGRLGLAVGRKVGVVNYYGKASFAREFTAETGVTASSSALPPVTCSQDYRENWLEFALGLTAKLDKKTDGYLEVTRATGGRTKTPWQFNVGARWNF